MRFSTTALLLSLAWLLPAPAEAQVFLDFSPPEWSDVCYSGCDVFLDETVEGSFRMTSGDACPPGGDTCLEAYAPEPFGVSIHFDDDGQDSDTVYFEAMVWHDGDAPTRDLFLAKRPGDHEVVLMVLADGGLRLETQDVPGGPPESFFNTPAGSTPVPPRTWVRVGLRLTILSDLTSVAYEITLDDRPAYTDSLDYGFDLPQFEQYYALGGYPGAARMRLDDVCLGYAASVRESFCEGLRATPLADAGMPPGDAAMPPADSGTPPTEDAAAADAEPPPQDSSSDASEGGSSFRGSGGCTCDTAGSPSPLGAGASLAALVLLFALRRRR